MSSVSSHSLTLKTVRLIPSHFGNFRKRIGMVVYSFDQSVLLRVVPAIKVVMAQKSKPLLVFSTERLK